MKKIEISETIKNDLEGNHLPLLEDENILHIFRPVYKMTNTILELNATVAYIIYAYTNESKWLNVRQDRYQNKENILKGMSVAITDYFRMVIDCEHPTVNDVISEWLINESTWEFRQVMSNLDYHQRMIKFVNQRTA